MASAEVMVLETAVAAAFSPIDKSDEESVRDGVSFTAVIETVMVRLAV